MDLSQHDLVSVAYTLIIYLNGLIITRFGQCGIHSDYTLVVLSQHDLVSVAYTLVIYLDGLITARFCKCGIHSDYIP